MKAGSTPLAKDYFKDLESPHVADMQLQLEQLVSQGTISPEEAQTIMQDPSAFNNIQTNPEFEQAQMMALSQLQDIGSQGGLTKTDRARLGQIKTQEDTSNRGRREAIMQNANARGMGGSGLELASQLQNQQDSASRTSQRNMDVGALAEQRALDAIMQSGQLAGGMQNNAFNQQAASAGANDAISKFNAQNSQAQINQNVGNRNAAREANLANSQNIANQNVGLRNQSQMHNKGLVQQQFNNDMNIRQGRQGVAVNNASAQGQNSQAKADAFNKNVSIGAGAAYGGAGYLAAEQARRKKEEGLL